MNDQIDYCDKINYFKDVTSTQDDDTALKYLLKNQWDLEKATKNYFDDIIIEQERSRESEGMSDFSRMRQFSPNHNPGIVGNFFDSMNNMLNFRNPLIDSFFSKPEESTLRTTNIEQSREYLSPSIQHKSPLKNELLKFLPFHANSLKEFYQKIKKNIGILFIYKEKDIETFSQMIDCLFRDHDMLHILETHFVTYSTVDESSEAQTILNRNRYKISCCLFMYNPRNLNEDNPQIIIDKLEGHFHEDSLIATIYKTLTNIENIEKGTYVNNIQPSYPEYQHDYQEDDSHSSIIRKQNEELRRLEQEEENKKRRIKFEEDLRKQKEKEEKDNLKKKMEEQQRTRNMKLFKLKQLPAEPSADDKNSTHIMFRLPDGIHRVERRFLKKDTIGDLYNYIEALDNANFNHEGKFELIQTFPFVLFNDKDKTLEEEKLFPNAIIQIREKDELQ